MKRPEGIHDIDKLAEIFKSPNSLRFNKDFEGMIKSAQYYFDNLNVVLSEAERIGKDKQEVMKLVSNDRLMAEQKQKIESLKAILNVSIQEFDKQHKNAEKDRRLLRFMCVVQLLSALVFVIAAWLSS